MVGCGWGPRGRDMGLRVTLENLERGKSLENQRATPTPNLARYAKNHQLVIRPGRADREDPLATRLSRPKPSARGSGVGHTRPNASAARSGRCGSVCGPSTAMAAIASMTDKTHTGNPSRCDIERRPLLDQGIATSGVGADGNLIGIERDEGFFRVAEAASGLAREAMPADGTGNPRVLSGTPWLSLLISVVPAASHSAAVPCPLPLRGLPLLRRTRLGFDLGQVPSPIQRVPNKPAQRWGGRKASSSGRGTARRSAHGPS